mgnify:CR=1 FL=1
MNRRWAAGIAAAAALLAALVGWWALRPGSASAPVTTPGSSFEATQGAAPGVIVDRVETPKVIEARSASGIPLRVTRTPRIDVPLPPYGPAYQRLREGAETAVPATQYQLGLLLYRCRDAASDGGDLARQIDQLYQTRRSRGWDVDDPAQEELQLREDYSACAGIPAAERQDYRLWMQRAAERGLMDAQLNLMFHLPRADYCQFIQDCTASQLALMATLRDEARAQVAKALAAGSVEALRTVGGWHLNEEMGTPDEVEAYAHFSAYDQIQQAVGRERELTAMLAGIKSRLRPVDLERAEARAKDLLSNPSCCVLTR